MKSKFNLKFDDSFNGYLFTTQGDTGREFEITIRDEFDDIVNIQGYRLEFFVGNADEVTKVEAENADNKFVVKPVSQQFKFAGLNKAQFVLYNPDGLKVGSQIFDLHVEESIENGATIGQNVLVDFEEIKKASELIKNYETIFEESKVLDVSLKESIKTGTRLNEALTNIKTTANESKAELENALRAAITTKNGLNDSILIGNPLKSGLDESIKLGQKTKTELDTSKSEADNIKENLDNSTSVANTIKVELDNSIKSGNNVNTALEKTVENAQNANTTGLNVKTELDNSITSAIANKSELDTTIIAAATKNNELKQTTTTAESTDTEAKSTMETLQALLSESQITEQSLKDIIASGNLEQYITEPKLKAEIAKIKTFKKEVVDVLPVTGIDDVIYLVRETGGQANNNYLEYLWINNSFELIGSTQVDLSGYVKKTELPKKLSEMAEDSTHRLVTDAEKHKWNNKVEKSYVDEKVKTNVPENAKFTDTIVDISGKVDKVSGKGLSSNDYTNDDMNKVRAIPADPKYTDTVTPIINSDGQASTSNVFNAKYIKDNFPKIVNASSTNLNSITKYGAYSCRSNANTPSGAGNYGALLVLKADHTISDTFSDTIQVYFGHNDRVFMRNSVDKNNGAWTSWKEIGKNVEIVNNLTSGGVDKALSAEVGRWIAELLKPATTSKNGLLSSSDKVKLNTGDRLISGFGTVGQVLTMLSSNQIGWANAGGETEVKTHTGAYGSKIANSFIYAIGSFCIGVLRYTGYVTINANEFPPGFQPADKILVISGRNGGSFDFSTFEKNNLRGSVGAVDIVLYKIKN